MHMMPEVTLGVITFFSRRRGAKNRLVHMMPEVKRLLKSQMRLAEGFFLPKDAGSDHFFFSAAWGQKPSHAHDAGGEATFVNDGLMPTITLNPHHGFFEE